MMPVNYEEPRWTTINVSSYATASNNENQWQIKGRWEWTPAGNRWGITTWADKNVCPEVIAQGVHQVLVERGALQKKQDGSAHDGSQDWMYAWRIIQWGENGAAAVPSQNGTQPAQQPAPMREPAPAPAPAPAPPAPAPAPASPAPEPALPTQGSVSSQYPYDDPVGMKMSRSAALKCASAQMVPFVEEIRSHDMIVADTIKLTEMYLEYILTGNVPEGFTNEEF